MTPQWLKDYYGIEFEDFNPQVIKEGRKYAIVKLSRPTSKSSAHSSIGYVLLRKGGRHHGTGQKSLHEGIATQADMDRMMEALKKEDA